MRHSLVLLFSVFCACPALAAPVVEVVDPPVLEQLDKPGVYSLATILGLADQESDFLARSQGDLQLKGLKVMRLGAMSAAKNAKYDSLAERVRLDVEEIKKASGEKMAFSSEEAEKLGPAGNVARHFDPFWLSSPSAGFPLIAVVNRIDRKDFSPGTCGEVRFIYRLAYYRSKELKGALQESRSTLPLFLNVIFEYPQEADGSCREIAKAWAPSPAADPAEEAARLLAGPLAKAKARLKQIELNMQIVRFPSGQKIDFGGQAIYLFRIFQEQAGALVAVPLENTPNVAEIKKSKSLQDSLVRQIAAGLQKIDTGTFVLENSEGKLLATKALSFSTSGRARLANKPFTAIFGAEAAELARLDFKALSTVKGAKGLTERLNNLSCTGCHQSSGTAGFHFLGMTGSLNSTFNQVVLPFSPHYYAERVRRQTYVAKLGAGEAANEYRPLSFAPPADWSEAKPKFGPARVRDLCLPAGAEFGEGIACEAGAECRLNVTNKAVGITVGECVLKKNVVAGHVCRDGAIKTSALELERGELYNLRSFRDTVDIEKTFQAGGLACGNPKGGVPLGRISKACESDTAAGRLEFVDKLKSGDTAPAEICAMRGGAQFDECAATANPPDCLAKAKIARGLLDSCQLGRFCREDYICQKLPEDVSRLYSGAEKELVKGRIRKLGQLGIGFCVPNYFLFNMRADGHLIPEGRKGAN
jgi:hypothetical protein